MARRMVAAWLITHDKERCAMRLNHLNSYRQLRAAGLMVILGLLLAHWCWPQLSRAAGLRSSGSAPWQAVEKGKAAAFQAANARPGVGSTGSHFSPSAFAATG